MCQWLENELIWGINCLKEKGIKNPRLDAELLLAYALETERANLYLETKRVLNDPEKTCFRRLLERRANHEPIAYILGKKEFMSLEFKITPAVLIPRPETELLVEEVVKIEKGGGERSRRLVVVEIGTGCGNIAVSLAKLLPHSQIYATDISKEALFVAQENIKYFGLIEQITLLEGNLFAALNGLGLEGQVDIIISNPPYVPQEEWEDLPLEIHDFEPRIALEGGNEGMKFFREIIEKAYIFLKNSGLLALEIGMAQGEKIRDFTRAKGVYGDPQIIKDYRGIDRVVIIQKKPPIFS